MIKMAMDRWITKNFQLYFAMAANHLNPKVLKGVSNHTPHSKRMHPLVQTIHLVKI